MLTPSEINPRYALTPIHVLQLVGKRIDRAGLPEKDEPKNLQLYLSPYVTEYRMQSELANDMRIQCRLLHSRSVIYSQSDTRPFLYCELK